MATITWTNLSGGLWSTNGNWSSDSVPGAADTVQIVDPGTYTVTLNAAEAAASMLIDDAGATLAVSSTLNTSGDIALQAGTLALNVGGWIDNATLQLEGGTLATNNGTLSGVSVDGAVTMGAGAVLNIANGTAFYDATGTQPGTINITGNGAALYAINSNLLDSVSIDIGSASGSTLDAYDAVGSNAMLTLGPNAIVTQTGANALFYSTYYTGDGFTNEGNIALLKSGGTASFSGTNFVDASTGTISISGETVSIGANTAVNAGSINVSGGGKLSFSGAWTSSGAITANASTVTVAGSTNFASVNTIAMSNGGTLNLTGTIDGSAGGTLSVGAGTNLGTATLLGSAHIHDGTIVDNGSGMAFQGGTLDGVAYRGTMDLSGGVANVSFVNGTTVTDITGTNPGVIKDTGASSDLYEIGSTTLDAVTIQLGNSGSTSYISAYDTGTGNDVLTLGPAATVAQTGHYGDLAAGYNAGDAIINQGSINATLAAGSLTTGGREFFNQGSITVANGASFLSQTSTFANSGFISVAASSTLSVGGFWSNTGSIGGTGGQIDLAGTGNAAGLGTLTNAGGTVTFDGYFDLQSGTLAIGAGTSLGETALAYPGTIHGGTLLDASGGGMLFQDGMFDAITYEGTLNLSQATSDLNFRNGLTVTDATGTLPGTINLTGANSNIYAYAGGTLGDATLNNATVNIGNSNSPSYLDAYDYVAGGNARLVLGASLNVVHAGINAQFYAGYQTGDAVINDGTVTAALSGGQFVAQGYSFANAGTVAVSNGDKFTISSSHFSNTGTMSAASGATLQIGGTWSNTGQVSSTNATLTLAGSTSFTNLGSIQRSGGVVNLDGALEGNGGTLEFGSGTALGQLVLENLGSIHNGTLLDEGGGSGMVFANGTFDTVTYAGTLDMSTAVANLSFINSLTLTDVTGTQPGDILLTGANATLYGYHNAILNNATVQIGNSSGSTLYAYDNTGGNAEMTLGANLSVVHTGKSVNLIAGNNAGDGFLNQGTITAALSTGAFTISGHNFSNDATGTISVGNNDSFNIASATMTNSGAMSVSSGGTLALNSVWNNLGTIAETGGTLTLGGTGSFGGIGTVNRTGGVINVSGTLNGGGGTLDIGAGTALGALVLQPSGQIRNGTLADSGSGLLANNGTLSGVTYLGTLDMSGTNAYLNVVNGITFGNLAGTGPGQWNLTGNGATGWIYGTTTLSNVTINMGGAGGGSTLYAFDNSAPPVTLTLGSSVTIAQVGGAAALRTEYGSGDRIINQGTIAAGGAGALFTIAGTGTFTDQGVLSVANGGSLSVAGIGTFSNLAGTTLTGGTYEVGANSIFQLATNASIVTDAADIVLSGTASVLQGLKTSGNTEQTIDNTLASIAAGGTLALLAGRNFAAGATLTDSGLLQLGGTTLSLAASVNSLAVGTGGTLFGYGTVNFGAGKGADALADAGLIEANGGTLLIDQPVSGSGSYQIDAGATLELAGSATAASVATFNGAGGVLKLDAPASFAGTIADFGAGVLIDLTGINATAASISGNTLTVTKSGSGTLTYAVSGNTSTGALRVASDGTGGTLITGYQLAVASTYAPDPVALPNVHVGDTDTQALTLSNVVSTGTFSESLNASIGAATGAVQATGAIADLAPGGTDNSSLVVGLNTGSDGLRSGTASIALSSDGTPVAGDGYGPVGIGAQQVNVSGAVYAYASPQFTGANEQVGASRVGGPELQGTMTVADGTSADPYQESLVYAADASASGFQLAANGAGTVVSGSTADIGLTLPSTTAGIFTGPVVLTLVSTGAGTSGLPDTPLGQTSLDITGKVYTPAVPDVLTGAVDFGNIHVGGTADGSIEVANASTGALPDLLTGGLNALTAPYVGNGTLGAGVAQGATGDIPISFQPAGDGLFTASANLALTSHDSDQPDLPLSTGAIALSGTAWAYAAPQLNGTVLNFGAARVGDTLAGQTLTIADGASADPYQESLVYAAAAPVNQGYDFGGSLTGTLPSGSSADVTVSLDTGTAGDFTGVQLPLAETSTGQGTSGLPDTVLTGQTVTLDGKVYAPAVPALAATAAPFNVHAGQVASEQITLDNSASGALADSLTGGFGTVSSPWQGGGSLNVAAGGSGTITLSMNTSTDGNFTGTADLALFSHDADQSDLALDVAPLALSGTVYGYADPILQPQTLNFGAVRQGDIVAAQTVTVANGTSVDPYQEFLTYNVVQPTSGFDDTTVASGNVLSGGTAPIGLALDSGTAGDFSNQQVTVDLGSHGLAGSGFGETGLPAQTIAVSGKVYAPAVPSLAIQPQPFNAHVGQAVSQTLDFGNLAFGALTDTLTGGFGAVSSPWQGGGALNVAAGGSGNLTLTMNTSSDGSFSGTADLALLSHDSDLSDLALAYTPLTLTGNVYAYAAPKLAPQTVNFGAARAGGTVAAQIVTLSNGASADAYQESLVYAAQQPPAGYTDVGTAAGTISSGSSAPLTLKMLTTTAGDFSSEQVTLDAWSDGLPGSGFGYTALPNQTIAVSGKVYAPAVPALVAPPPVFHVHVGQSLSEQLVFGNAALGSLTDLLTGGFGTVTGPWQGSGALSVAAGSSGSLTLTLPAQASDGVITGSAAFALDSHDSDLSDLPLSFAAKSLSAIVYAYAAPSLSAPTLNFGAERLGSAPVVQTVNISDGTTADPYQESLYYLVTQPPAGFTYVGAGSGTIASGGTNTISLEMLGSTPGNYTNAPIVIADYSHGMAASGFGNTAIASETVAVTGQVYAPARPAGVENLSFGIVHVGQTASYNMNVTNLANGALQDALVGNWGTVSNANFIASGALSNIAAGSSGTLTMSLNTAAAGVYTGNAQVLLTSHDNVLPDLPLASSTISLFGEVVNYAAGGFKKITGSGVLTGSGTNYTLSLGDIVQNSGSVSAELAAFNAAIGPADQLTGTLTLSPAPSSPDFVNSALTGFGPLSAQQIGEEPTVTLDPTVTGIVQEQIVLSGTGTDADYSGAVPNVTLTVTGTVTNQPTMWTLTHTTTNIVVATGSNDVFNASNGVLWSGDSINGGSSANTLDLNGGGQFDLSQPTQLTGITQINAQEGQRYYLPLSGPAIPSTYQTVTLRAGLNATVTVASDPSPNASDPYAPGITIVGAANNDIINLGNGTDTVTLGGPGETVNGGSGSDTYNVTAATIGATINGGSGKSILAVSGGGAATMGSNLVGITNVNLLLTAGSPAFVFTANADPGITIVDYTDSANTIVLGAASDVLNMDASQDHVMATAAIASALIKNPGAGSELEITTGGTVTLNANTYVSTVKLDAATTLTLSKIAGITAIGSGGGDTITAGTEQQTITGIGSGDTLIASIYHGDVFKDLTANLNGITIKNFGGASGWNDSIDFTNLNDSHLTWNYASGKLTVGDGTHSATLSVAGSGLTKTDFVPTVDGSGGTVFTFHVS